MSYHTEYALRYELPNVQHQTEVAVVIAAGQILSEDPATPDHGDRVAWANFVMGIGGSSQASQVFLWPVAANPTIQASVQADPTGNSVADSDVQFVVNSNIAMAVQQYKSSAYYRPPPA